MFEKRHFVNKMWLPIVLMCTYSSLVLALNLDDVNFGIEYFKYRGVKFVCLLTCDKDVFWSLHFSKKAANDLIYMSEVKIDLIDNYNTSLYYCLHHELISIGVLLNGYCREAEEAMYLASENFSYSAQHKWLIIEDDRAISKYYNVSDNTNIDMKLYEKNSNSVLNVLDKLNISVDADIIVGGKDDSGYYTLYEVFNFGKIQGGNLIANKIGSWNTENGLMFELDPNEYKYYRRWDFLNWTMRMILVRSPKPKQFDLNLLLASKPIPGVARITHVSGAALCIIAEKHYFRYNTTITDRWIASFDKNATRVATNSLYFREQDVTPLVRYMSLIQDKIDVSGVPLQMLETKFYYRIPTKGPGKLENQFLMPLSPLAWYGVIGISVLCALILLLSAHLEQRPSSTQYAIFSIVALICQQFYEDSNENRIKRFSTARKLLILVSGLFCVLIYNYYTSSVVSWLLNGPPPSIRNLRELLESSLELIFEDVGYTRSWLQFQNFYYNRRNALVEDQLRQKKIINKKKTDPLLVSLVEGIKLVRNGGYAYHAEVSGANALISKTFDQAELCELGSLQVIEKTPMFTCLSKGSPYKEFITWSEMRLFERGFISCIRARTASPEIKCNGSSPRALALGGAAPAFMLIAVGYLIATIIMLIERVIFKRQKNK